MMEATTSTVTSETPSPLGSDRSLLRSITSSENSCQTAKANLTNLEDQLEHFHQKLPGDSGHVIIALPPSPPPPPPPHEDPIYSNNNDNNNEGPILLQWTLCTVWFHNAISQAVVSLSRLAAQNPKRVIGLVILLSLLLPPIGLVTNFSMEVEQEAILAPFNSLSRQNYDWIEQESGFPESTRPFDLLIHQKGDNVLTVATMRRVFQAINVFRNTPGYTEICAAGNYHDSWTDQTTCKIHAATRFWWHNVTYFEEQIQTDQDLIMTLSADEYPLGTPVGDHDFILGNYQVMDEDGDEYYHSNDDNNDNNSSNTTGSSPTRILTSAQSYIVRIDVPVVKGETSAFEDYVTQVMLELRQSWQDDDSPVRLEFFTFRSIPNEFTRAIAMDLPLYPAVFFIMCGFACATFFRWDRVHSRSLLGIGSVCTIALSLMTGKR